jgi:Domain of unknown function (DU1801)
MRGKPAEPLLRRIRDVIMWADDRMTEYLKYGTVQFACKGDFANFVRHDQKTVTLMFNRGAKIPGKYGHLEGSGPSARFMRFADLGEVDAKTSELSKLAVAWCDMMVPRKVFTSKPGPKRRGRPRLNEMRRL